MFGKSKIKTIATVISMLAIAALVLGACAPAPTPTPAPTTDPSVIQTQAVETAIADMTKNAPPPTAVPPAPTATPPPPGPTPDPNIPVDVIPTPAAGQPSAIANYNTVIMSGPGINYVVYSALNGGKSVLVTGKSEDGLWWAVSVPVAPTGTGWVEGAWVTVSNAGSVPTLPTPPVPPTAELVPPGSSDPQATTLANTYVRSGPAVNFPAYGVAPAGMTGAVIGVSEDRMWWAVRLDPAKVGIGYGWVEAAYVQASNTDGVQVIKSPSSSTTTPPPPPPAGAPSATAMDYVNVRTGPSTSYPVLIVAPPGAAGEVTGKSSDGQWWQVKISPQYSSNERGWVMGSYVYVQNTDSVPVVTDVPPPPEVPPTAPPPPTTSGYGCTLVSQSPADNTTFGQGASFTTTWVLKNTGSVAWDDNATDLGYVGAYNNIRLHTGPDLYDFNTVVNPGSTFNFSVPMLTPYGAGQYGEMWQIQSGGTVICQFYVYITVQ